MNALFKLDAPPRVESDAFAKCIAASKRVRWDIDADVIRGRRLNLEHKFLPDGLSKAHELDFLTPAERRYLSQVQGRTYANMFGLFERYVGAKVIEVSQDYVLGDQSALEALIRFGDEELKHQELFRRIERLVAEVMPEGYAFDWDPNEVARQVLAKGTWAVMGLTLFLELFTQMHFRQSVEPDQELSPLFKDVLLYHWREECQHAVLDELEWRRSDAAISDVERDHGVDELIELVGAVDAIVQRQSAADADYFLRTVGRRLEPEEATATRDGVLAAYRWQFILSGAEHPHFLEVLCELTTEAQQGRIMAALATLR